MERNRSSFNPFDPFRYGMGFPAFVAGNLYSEDPTVFEVINKGNGGNRVVDLYSRIKADVRNLKPDVLSILIGINDVWHKISNDNGVEIERYEKVYRMLIEDTKKVLPDVKIILCEPFFTDGAATIDTPDYPDRHKIFCEVYDYAKVVRRIAQEHDLFFLPLQEKFDEVSKKFAPQYFLYDGVHPSPVGAKIIADEWLKLFKQKIL